MRYQNLTPLFAILFACLVLPLAGCGGEGSEESANGTSSPPATKAAVIAHLQGVLKAIQSEDWDEAAAHFHFGSRAPATDRWPEMFQGMVKKSEISEAGIAILAEKGTFGTLEATFAERGASWAKRAEVPLERCHGLSHDGAEVAVFASDDGLKLIRLDDVGKLR